MLLAGIYMIGPPIESFGGDRFFLWILFFQKWVGEILTLFLFKKSYPQKCVEEL